MGPLDFALHLTGFAAPAVFLALFLPLASRLLLRRQAGVGLGWQVAWVLLVGLAVLAGGLWWSGRDGKMLTYAALAVAAASTQWLAARSWR
jgi:hypothetical protein